MGLKRKIATVELADGRILTDIRIITPDTVRYEETAQKHNWPSLTVRNGSGTTPHLDHQERFEIWAALRRLKEYEGPWEEFKTTDLIDYTVEVVEVDPIQPDPGTG